MRALAEARIDYARLHSQSTDEVVAALTAVKGIGRWTAEIYAMFALGHSDAFAAGDLALQEAARVLFDLPQRPDERRLRAMAAPWSPHRAIAARALWGYYHMVKEREGVA
jgi:DNA-3-methyladenine glycosylase II